MKREPVGTVLVGPSALLREGLARILSTSGFRILASLSSIDDSLLGSLPHEQSLLLVIDISDDFDAALRQVGSFKHRCPAGRVAVLAHQQQLTEMVSAFQSGVNAYLVKVASCDTFIKSLELVMLGVTLLPPELLTFVSDRQEHDHAADDKDGPDDEHPDDDDGAEGIGFEGDTVGTGIGLKERVERAQANYTPSLSDRQRSILGCLIQGDSNKTIARKMAITEATVKVHVKAILRKIRVHNRTQAAIWAMSTGPFISAKDDASSDLARLPVESLPAAGVVPALAAGHENGSAFLPTLEFKGSNRAALQNIVRFVHKGIRKKSD
jgi:two-component system, NarL family, nitrate/nitrite response regulator NarL